jgi:CxxC motif-containing protein (DUF1111 family)
MNRRDEIRSSTPHGLRDPSAWRGARATTTALVLGVLCSAATALPFGDVPKAGQVGGPVAGLSKAEYRLWRQGREVFDRDFTVETGLGVPEFNADSCRACHGDPVVGGAGALELNVARFGNDNGGAGPFVNLAGGPAASKLRPPPDGTRENYPVDEVNPLDNADVFEQRQTPTILGMGLIDGISDAEILSNEDPLDLDGDGIFGVARIVMVNGSPEVGRFGWKAQVPRTHDFARDGMGGENGITTPDDGRGFAFVSDSDSVPDPELSQKDLDALVFFMNKIAPPQRSNENSPSVQAGELVFSALRCDRCHIPELQGADGPVALYSDLLLHDVMPMNFRGMSEPGAGVGMYRTPPLWGIKDTAPYLHDGRAETIEQAIVQHRSEGLFSSVGYLALGEVDRRNLIEFLNSL